MVYTPLTEKAMKIAFAAHIKQKDKAGLPYFHHPMHLAEQFDDELLVTTALLHDVIEDTDTTIENLRNEEIPEDVLTALKLLTHEKHTDYMDYIRAIKDNSIAKQVKIEDLKHNLDRTRLRKDNCSNYDSNKINKRCEKYIKALDILTN